MPGGQCQVLQWVPGEAALQKETQKPILLAFRELEEGRLQSSSCVNERSNSVNVGFYNFSRFHSSCFQPLPTRAKIMGRKKKREQYAKKERENTVGGERERKREEEKEKDREGVSQSMCPECHSLFCIFDVPYLLWVTVRRKIPPRMRRYSGPGNHWRAIIRGEHV